MALGRPTKLTPDVQTEIVKRVGMGVSPEVAAQTQGINRATYYEWMARGRVGAGDETTHRSQPFADFHDAVKAADADAEAHCLGVIRVATNDSWQAAAWWLERKHPERWSVDRRKKAAEIEKITADTARINAEAEALKKDPTGALARLILPAVLFGRHPDTTAPGSDRVQAEPEAERVPR